MAGPFMFPATLLIPFFIIMSLFTFPIKKRSI